MDFIAWTSNLDTGNAQIDAQHHKLVEIINELHNAMITRQVPSTLATIFDELLTYTSTHFATEEKLFETVNYPQKAAHIQEHRELVRQALELQEKFKSGSMFVSIEVLDFLKNWISEHIQKMDKTYKGLL